MLSHCNDMSTKIIASYVAIMITSGIALGAEYQQKIKFWRMYNSWSYLVTIKLKKTHSKNYVYSFSKKNYIVSCHIMCVVQDGSHFNIVGIGWKVEISGWIKMYVALMLMRDTRFSRTWGRPRMKLFQRDRNGENARFNLQSGRGRRNNGPRELHFILNTAGRFINNNQESYREWSCSCRHDHQGRTTCQGLHYPGIWTAMSLFVNRYQSAGKNL